MSRIKMTFYNWIKTPDQTVHQEQRGAVWSAGSALFAILKIQQFLDKSKDAKNYPIQIVA